MKKPGNKKLLKSNRISGFQKADHQKLPIDKTRRIILKRESKEGDKFVNQACRACYI